MAVQNVTLDATALGGVIIGGGAGANKAVGTTGRISVTPNDAPSYIRAGARYVSTLQRNQALSGPPAAASAGRIVASTALANGTLAIANQPDVTRQIVARVDPGGTAITGGTLALTYVGNDGASRTDSMSLATPASTVLSSISSRGVQTLTSAIVTGVAGGASPVIQINDTNSLSVQVDPNFADFNVTRQFTDGVPVTGGTIASSAASITPTTTPNGTHTYGFNFGYTAP